MPKKAKAEIAGWCVVRIKRTGKVECLRHTLKPSQYHARAMWCHPDKRWKERPHGIEVMPVGIICDYERKLK